MAHPAPPSRSLALFIVLVSLLSGGCPLLKGDDNDDDDDDEFVDSFSYVEEMPTYLATLPITPNEIELPEILPDNPTFTVTPALPAGLVLGVDGTLEGTPEATSPTTTYTVLAEGTTLFDAVATLAITVLEPVAPSGLAYSENPATYVANQTITPNVPSFTGVIDTFSASPPLPNNLRFANDGRIVGRAQQAQDATVYTITGTNPFGSTSVDVSIEVLNALLPRNLLLLDNAEPVMGQYVADSFPGDLYARGFQSLSSPGRALLGDPLGRFAWVLQSDGSITRLLQTETADVQQAGVVANVVAGATHLAIDEAGTRMAVLSATLVTVFDVDGTGVLSNPQQASVPAGGTDLAMHPSGSFVYVGGAFSGALLVYAVDDGITQLAGSATVDGNVGHLALTADGVALYASVPADSLIYPFAIDTGGANASEHLQIVGPPRPVSAGPEGLAVVPDGSRLFASTGFNGSVVELEIDNDGSLLAGVEVPIGTYITELDVDPGSDLLYALDIVERQIYVSSVRNTIGAGFFTDRGRTLQAPGAMKVLRGDPVARSTRHVFLANREAGTVDVLAFDRSSEELSVGVQTTGLSAPGDLAFDERRGVLHVVQRGAGSVASFTLDANASSLEPLVPQTLGAGEVPTHITLGASGRFAYVVDSIGDLRTFDVDPNSGALSLAGAALGITANAGPLAADPTGQFLYLLEPTQSRIALYTLDPTSGLPTFAERVDVGSTPSDLVLAPQGFTLFHASSGAGVLESLSIDALDGTLTLETPSSPVGTGVTAIDIVEQGFNVYAGGGPDDNISIHSVDFETGLASEFEAPVSPVAVSANLTDIAVDQGDLYTFAAFSGAEPRLAVLRSQPTSSILEVDSIPIAAGTHTLEVSSEL